MARSRGGRGGSGMAVAVASTLKPCGCSWVALLRTALRVPCAFSSAGALNGTLPCS